MAYLVLFLLKRYRRFGSAKVLFFHVFTTAVLLCPRVINIYRLISRSEAFSTVNFFYDCRGITEAGFGINNDRETETETEMKTKE